MRARLGLLAPLLALSLALTVSACGGGENRSSFQSDNTPPRVQPGHVDGPMGEEVPDYAPQPVDGSRYAHEIEIRVDEGTTLAHVWKPASPSSIGVLFVSGVDGGFIEPVDGIYTRLADRLVQKGIPSIFVRYRDPGVLDPSVTDALAGVAWLKRQGVQRIAILGWSFGGAVITNATVRAPEIETVIGFAPQSELTEPVAQFTHQSLLLFHSKNDENVPYESGSPVILEEAPATIRKELVTFEEEDHYLTGAGPRIDPKVESWLQTELGIPRFQARVQPAASVQPASMPSLSSSFGG